MQNPIRSIFKDIGIASGYCIVVYIGEYMCVVEKRYVYIYYNNIITIYQMIFSKLEITACKRGSLKSIDRPLSPCLLDQIKEAVHDGFCIIPYARHHETNFIQYDKYFTM